MYPPFKLKRKAGCRSVAAPCRFQALRALGFGVILCVLVRIALDLVGLAGGHVVVVDGIADSDIFLARNRLVTVGSIDGGGADNGSLHGNGLVNVVDILVVGNLDTVRGKGLEGDELGAGLDAAGIEGETLP